MLTSEDKKWITATLDEKIDAKLVPIHEKLNALKEGVRVLVLAEPRLWELYQRAVEEQAR